MTLQEIYNNLNVIIKKEVRGNRLSLYDFNLILESGNTAFFKRKLDTYLSATNQQRDNGDFSPRFIDSYISVAADETVTSGTLALTAIEADTDDIAAIISITTTLDSSLRQVNMVSPEEADRRRSGLTWPRVQHNPVCYRVGDNLNFLPADITPVDVVYAKWGDIPFQDFYIDVSGDVQYLAAGAADHVWATGEIDSAGTTHTLGDSDWAVLTKELTYEPTFHYEFMMDCLAQYGISLQDPNLVQYAEGKKQEVNTR